MSIDYKKEIAVDRRSSTPYSEQINDALELLILNGRVINDQPLLPANELSKILGFGQKDVEEAYQSLEKNNFIYYDLKGIPHVSKYSRILDFFNKLIYIEDGIERLNKKPSIELHAFEIVDLKESSVINLDQYQDKRFLKQARMFKADGEPYMFTVEYYSVQRFPKLLELRKDYSGFIYRHFLNKEYDIEFLNNQRYMHVITVNQELSELLQVKKGLSIFKFDLIYYDQEKKPFGYGHAYSLPRFYFDYTIKIK